MPGPGTPDWVSSGSRPGTASTVRSTDANDYDTFIRTYHETILSVDDSVGAIYETLRAMGELDNTIFVFAGDNGFLLGEHASIDKRTMWEESIRIPLLVRYPEAIRDPRVVDRMVLNLDRRAERPRSVRRGAASEAFTASRSEPRAGPRTGVADAPGCTSTTSKTSSRYTPNVRGVRTDEWSYMHYPNGEGQPDTEKAELYNIKTDPRQKQNLIDDPRRSASWRSSKRSSCAFSRTTGGLPDRCRVNPSCGSKCRTRRFVERNSRGFRFFVVVRRRFNPTIRPFHMSGRVGWRANGSLAYA